jgi:uncharacterized protein (DUF488 family)
MRPGKNIVYTLGHSTRKINEMLEIIESLGIEIVIDIRRWPSSRKAPWFNRETLQTVLQERGVRYLWLGKELGGYRKFGVDIPYDLKGASCFKSEGFRAYALYVTTNHEAEAAVNEIVRLAGEKNALILCAERLPWRCHRKIIADILTLKGFNVVHILDKTHYIKHKPSKCVTLTDHGKIKYI